MRAFSLDLSNDPFLTVLHRDDYHDLDGIFELYSSLRTDIIRNQDFYLGRLAAALTLRKLGSTNLFVDRGISGEPLWPEGIQGSITHCDGWAAAIALRKSLPGGVGLDIEKVLSSDSWVDVLNICANEQEKNWVLKTPNEEGVRTTMLFSIKECLYKAFFPVVRTFIDFLDVEVLWDHQQKLFNVRFLNQMFSDARLDIPHSIKCIVQKGYVFSSYIEH